ncbi:MAG: DnaJ domain-containing protein [Oscillospiraceae bacterium]|jgi:curved DNA-binding protein CbpA|nr:DnaJ domain-containing protein [Oscillospiraceae bacterium]
MTDPYKVLNIDPRASDDEVKQAYRDLARKYHPDSYADNPLSDLAEEKMKEINEAYDQIMKQRGSGGNSRSYYSNSSDSGYNSADAGGVYMRIRQYISMGNLVQAEQMLGSVPEKNAEWYFLSGSIAYRKGWFDEALRNFQTACDMDPNNLEYRRALSTIQGRGGYRSPVGQGGGMSTCDCCSSLICADCCCECMGGDLIPCC